MCVFHDLRVVLWLFYGCSLVVLYLFYGCFMLAIYLFLNCCICVIPAASSALPHAVFPYGAPFRASALQRLPHKLCNAQWECASLWAYLWKHGIHEKTFTLEHHTSKRMPNVWNPSPARLLRATLTLYDAEWSCWHKTASPLVCMWPSFTCRAQWLYWACEWRPSFKCHTAAISAWSATDNQSHHLNTSRCYSMREGRNQSSAYVCASLQTPSINVHVLSALGV